MTCFSLRRLRPATMLPESERKGALLELARTLLREMEGQPSEAVPELLWMLDEELHQMPRCLLRSIMLDGPENLREKSAAPDQHPKSDHSTIVITILLNLSARFEVLRAWRAAGPADPEHQRIQRRSVNSQRQRQRRAVS